MNVLENYEILSPLGKGTFGLVRLGRDKSTGEKVAIKILEKNRIITSKDEERVKREMDILKKVNHINVIKIMKIEEDAQKIYLIMEFCEKRELFNYIVKKEKLDEIEAAYFYYQLINGLECLHHNGIAHRDLKPENLLISKDNILKIIDFGLSNYFSRRNYLTTPCGSPCYASPEMIYGEKYDGFLADIWTSGIVLYAMLCGYLPFEDPDNEALLRKIMRMDIEYPEDLSKDSIDLMEKILMVNPVERISIPEIKKHPFYLKGKNKFKSLHPNLVKEVEYYENNKEDKNEDTKKDIKRKNVIKKEYNYIKEVYKIKNENIIDSNNNNKGQKEEEKVNNKKVIEEKELIIKSETNKNDKTNEIKIGYKAKTIEVKNDYDNSYHTIQKIKKIENLNNKDNNKNIDKKNNNDNDNNNNKYNKSQVVNNGPKNNNIEKNYKLTEKKEVRNGEQKDSVQTKNNNRNLINNENTSNNKNLNNNTNQKIAQINNQNNNKRKDEKNIQNESEQENNNNKKYRVKKFNNNFKNIIINDSNNENNYSIYKNDFKDMRYKKTLNEKGRNNIDTFEGNNYNLKTFKVEKNKYIPKNFAIYNEKTVPHHRSIKKLENEYQKNNKDLIADIKVNKNNLNLYNNKHNYNSIDNTYNIKNRFDMDKNFNKEKNEEKSKLSVTYKKVDVIIEGKKEIKRERTPNIEQTKFIDSKNSKLIENGNISNQDNFISNKFNPEIKLRSMINTHKDQQDNRNKRKIIIDYNIYKKNVKTSCFNHNNYPTKDNPLSFSVLNINNKRKPGINMNSVEKLHNNGSNSMRSGGFLNIKAFNRINNLNINKENTSHYSQRNIINNKNKNNDNNISKFSLTNKNPHITLNNNIENIEYDSYTFNKNIIVNKIYISDNKVINLNPNLTNINIENKYGELYAKFSNKRKYQTETNIVKKLNTTANNNKNNNIHDYQNQNLKNYLKKDKDNDEKNINKDILNNNSKFNNNINNNNDNKIMHKKNISQYAYKNILDKKIEINDQDLKKAEEMKTPQMTKINEKTKHINLNQDRHNHRFYVSTGKKHIDKGKIINNMYNDLNISNKNETVILKTIKPNETLSLKNNYDRKISNQNSKKRLSEFSNSVEKYKNNNYLINYSTSPNQTLNPTIHHFNTYRYNKNIPKRNNSTHINDKNNLDNNNAQKKAINNNNVNVSNIANKNNEKILNNNLNKKSTIPCSRDKNNKNNNNIITDEKNSEIKNNIYTKKPKPNYKFLSIYSSTSNTPNENKFNINKKALTNTRNSFSKKNNGEDFDLESNRYKVRNINNVNNKKKEDYIYNSNEKNTKRKAFIRSTTESINLQESLKKNNLLYSSNINPVIKEYNYNRSINQINNKNIQINNNNYLRKTSNQVIKNNNNMDDIVTRLTKAKKDYLKYKNKSGNTFNYQNPNFLKPTSLINVKDLNVEKSDYLLYNNTNERGFESDSLKKDSLQINLNRSVKNFGNIIRGKNKFDNNNNYQYNQNTYFNNHGRIKINLYDNNQY